MMLQRTLWPHMCAGPTKLNSKTGTGRNCRNRVYYIFAIDAICCENSYLKVRRSPGVDRGASEVHLSTQAHLHPNSRPSGCQAGDYGCRRLSQEKTSTEPTFLASQSSLTLRLHARLKTRAKLAKDKQGKTYHELLRRRQELTRQNNKLQPTTTKKNKPKKKRTAAVETRPWPPCTRSMFGKRPHTSPQRPPCALTNKHRARGENGGDCVAQ